MGIALPHSWTIGLQKIIVRINHNTLSIGAILHCKRRPFGPQKVPFGGTKDALLHCKRASFVFQIISI